MIGCGPCYDNTINFNDELRLLIDYRYGTLKWLIKLLVEQKRTAYKYSVQDRWPFDDLASGKTFIPLINIMRENIESLKNKDRKFRSELHKQVMLSFIETDIAYLEKWLPLMRQSINPVFANAEFISGTEAAIDWLDKARLIAIKIPVGE